MLQGPPHERGYSAAQSRPPIQLESTGNLLGWAVAEAVKFRLTSRYFRTNDSNSSAVNHDRILLPLRCGEIGDSGRAGKRHGMQLFHLSALWRFVGLLLSGACAHCCNGACNGRLFVGRQIHRVPSLSELRLRDALGSGSSAYRSYGRERSTDGAGHSCSGSAAPARWRRYVEISRRVTAEHVGRIRPDASVRASLA
jgi:hypothetical protein